MYRLLSASFYLVMFMRSELTNGSVAVGHHYIDDKIPKKSTMKSEETKSVESCAIACARTNNCHSFAFGLGNNCSMWDAKYQVEDQLLQNATGHSYYHYNHKPEATQLKLFESLATFSDAVKTCQTLLNGGLVSIHNQQMQKKVEDLMAKYPSVHTIWIGMNGTGDGYGPKTAGGAFLKFDLRWSDGHVFTAGRFTNFISSDPNVHGKACVGLNTKGWGYGDYGWGDMDCATQSQFVCQSAPSQ